MTDYADLLLSATLAAAGYVSEPDSPDLGDDMVTALLTRVTHVAETLTVDSAERATSLLNAEADRAIEVSTAGLAHTDRTSEATDVLNVLVNLAVFVIEHPERLAELERREAGVALEALEVAWPANLGETFVAQALTDERVAAGWLALADDETD